MKTAVFLLFCAATCVLAQKQGVHEFSWTRTDVKTKDGEGVKESTEVNFRERLMLMKSSDERLRETPIARSESLHDFNEGLVALKPLDNSKHCFVAKVKRPFEVTLEELRNRDSKAGYELKSEQRYLRVDSQNPLRSSGSKRLDQFCEGRYLIRVVDVRPFPPGWFFPTYPPLLCIWGPIDTQFPDDILYQRGF